MTILAFPARPSEGARETAIQAPAATAEQRFYKVGEVAGIFECSPGMVYDLIRSGSLRAIDLGCGTRKRGKIRVRAEDIEDFYEQNLVQPEEGAL